MGYGVVEKAEVDVKIENKRHKEILARLDTLTLAIVYGELLDKDISAKAKLQNLVTHLEKQFPNDYSV